ncbi:hypothetical protein VPHF86_0234 [Vibrio phage F86]
MRTVLAIPMAGRGERMGDISRVVPKGLINYHNHTFLYHIYQYYDGQFDECVVTVASEFKDMLTQYAHNFGLELTIVIDDSYNGNSVILESIDADTVILNWCDVVPVDVDVRNLSDGVTVFTKSGTGRYVYDGSVVETAVDAGDFCGIYALHNTPEYNLVWGDFVDVMQANSFDVSLRACDVVDLGSADKLARTQESLPTCRYFNEIEFDDDTVTKRASGEEGTFKIRQEISTLLERRVGYVELLEHDESSYTMRRVDGRIPRQINAPMINEGDDVCVESIRREITHRILSRMRDIECYVGINSEDLVSGVKRIEEFVIENTTKFYDIHGDLVCDNAIETIDGDIVLIDPRGFFGHSKRGPIEYDTSKFLYSVNGYYKFNYDVLYDGNHARYDNHSDMSLLEEAWVATHWLALAGFFKNNPAKAIGAYHIGMCKMNRVIEKL